MTRLPNLTKSAILGSILTGCMLTAATAADLSVVPSGGYEVDPTHAYVNFQYNHLGLSNPTLSFDSFTVDLDLDNADPTKSSFMVKIDPASIVTGSEIWKEHITSSDWFDVAAHPEIAFQSTSVEAAGDGAYKVTGDLTIKEMTKPVTLSVSINAAMNHPMSGKPVIGLDASANVLRSEFGLGKLVPAVSDEIAINLSVEMVKAGE